MKASWLATLSLAFLTLVSGCSAGKTDAPEQEESQKIRGSLIHDPNSDKQLYLQYGPLAQPYQLELNLVGDKEFTSGDNARLRFRLKNMDSAAIQLDEWYMADPNNLILFFRPWSPNETVERTAAADWYVVEPNFSPDLPPPQRAPLKLEAGNMSFIDVPFPVINEIPADKSTYFLVYAKLNLVSVDVMSPMYTVKSVAALPADGDQGE